MQFLRQNSSITVRIGPAVDATDGVTPEIGVTLGSADQAKLLKHNGVAAVDISSNFFTAITGCDGWYDLDLTATDTNSIGLLDVVIQDSSLIVPIFKSFLVIPIQVWDSWFGFDILQVDAVEISSDSGAADNLESDYDGTGYSKTNSTVGTVTAITNAVDILQSAADKVWSSVARTLTSFSTLISDIWANATRTLTAGTKDTEIDAIKAKTDNHPADLDAEITLLKGLMGVNCVLDDFVYNTDGKATVGNLYIYNSVANANIHDKSTGLLLRIDSVATITGGNTTKLTRTVG